MKRVNPFEVGIIFVTLHPDYGGSRSVSVEHSCHLMHPVFRYVHSGNRVHRLRCILSSRTNFSFCPKKEEKIAISLSECRSSGAVNMTLLQWMSPNSRSPRLQRAPGFPAILITSESDRRLCQAAATWGTADPLSGQVPWRRDIPRWILHDLVEERCLLKWRLLGASFRSSVETSARPVDSAGIPRQFTTLTQIRT